ncbi:Uu.00g013320.m01.CDS01 [Anthostomella pinea]|uniref:Uu.00g013320.m01.CDS01 n=1 Tax=Anthostomella pinea TaxID=933095 RepID=A0AAI8VZC4_9PEZI|nr:Uu.00g013320.m01.CDS01 [Anthostomella pinea]
MRWLSDVLVGYDEDSTAFKYLVRNEIIDQLRARDIKAIRTSERASIRTRPGGKWGDRLADLEAFDNENDAILDAWIGSYARDQSLSQEDNIGAAADILQEQFINYHTDNGIHPHRTRPGTLDKTRHRIPDFLVGFSDAEGAAVAEKWRQEMGKEIEQQKEDELKREGRETDPNCVKFDHGKPIYRTWTCESDSTVNVRNVKLSDYRLPAEYISDYLADQQDIELPNLYKWFSAEIRSPILDYDHVKTFPSITEVCAALQDTLRIHKPMSAVGSGLHIHIGQEAGWSLLTLKRFVTLWLLLEASFEHLHRIDRSQPATNTYCRPLRIYSYLAQSMEEENIDAYAQYQSTPNSQGYRERKDVFSRHVPERSVVADIFNLLQCVWHYENISHLVDAMGMSEVGDKGGSSCVRFRLNGDETTDRASASWTQTIEFGLMQGTLDANHIQRWMRICHRLVVFSRDTTPAAFTTAVQAIGGGGATSPNDVARALGFDTADLQ